MSESARFESVRRPKISRAVARALLPRRASITRDCLMQLDLNVNSVLMA